MTVRLKPTKNRRFNDSIKNENGVNFHWRIQKDSRTQLKIKR